jgi:hypothetical protein
MRNYTLETGEKMIRETICMYALWVLLKLFGQECFAVSAVCTLPDPALKVLSEYMQEVPA